MFEFFSFLFNMCVMFSYLFICQFSIEEKKEDTEFGRWECGNIYDWVYCD